MRISLSAHAIDKAQSRGVTWDEIHDILLHWTTRYESSVHQGRSTPHTYIYSAGGNVSVLTYEPRPGEVIVKTVLLKQKTEWNDDDARNRAPQMS